MRQYTLLVLIFITSKGFAMQGNISVISKVIQDRQAPLVVVDQSIKPEVKQLQVDGSVSRPLARIMAPSGIFLDIVVNEVVAIFDDPIERHQFLRRWNGKIMSKLSSPNPNQQAYIIRVDLKQSEDITLNQLIGKMDEKIHGTLKVSDSRVKRLLAIMAVESRENQIEVGFSMDMLLTRPGVGITVFGLPNLYPSNI